MIFAKNVAEGVYGLDKGIPDEKCLLLSSGEKKRCFLVLGNG